ncbi:DNA alkylation repair protein [Rhizobium sp. SL42]|uniref:DNA alkylation repair protein n=1 Tax=Rhizobium sp. SL42 TaxID=2806346 RepID=UPI001F2D5A89|nr:DNA alkylation repair protein [Rhizobium sp. SL42]UJW74421.1 DNA alkylation repair protein [Rhizobium sp. SL42]
MAEALKHLIGARNATDIADALSSAWTKFPRDAFLADILPRIESLELMQRGQLIADAMYLHLPRNFAVAAPILMATLPVDRRPGLSGWSLLAFNQYIAAHGLDHVEISLDLLKALTPHFTAEFGIRPFIHREQTKALSIIGQWADDPNHHVRRLASEGTRPRLPWAMRLPALVKDPAPLLPILTALIDDPEDYVRRSVANSLNDIAKDHQDLVADFVGRHHKGASAERLWLLRHASRTLLKKGHATALANFGFARIDGIEANLRLAAQQVSFPGVLDFSVSLSNKTGQSQSLMFDYAIHHQKKDGTLSPKIFKAKSLTLAAGQSMTFERRHAFRPITTRVYHPGEHRLEILVNGTSLALETFILTASGGSADTDAAQ